MLLTSKSYSKRNFSLTLPLKSLDISQNNFHIFLLNNQIIFFFIKKMTYNSTQPTERLLKISNNFSLLSQNKNPCIQYIYPLLTKPRIHKIIQSQKHSLDHLLQFYKVFFFYFFYFFFIIFIFYNFYFLLPLPPLVLFWHEDKSLTQAFIETLFFLYQVNK